VAKKWTFLQDKQRAARAIVHELKANGIEAYGRAMKSISRNAPVGVAARRAATSPFQG
jgi:hypothetical protein